MSHAYPPTYTGPVTSLDATLQEDLGLLMKDLSSHYDGRPLDSHDLELAINSPDQEQFVAIRGGRVIGAGSISIIPVSFSDDGALQRVPTAWLASFIVHKDYRGKLPDEDSSIASQLWGATVSWIKERNVSSLEFMTENDRGAALDFYHRKGAFDIGAANLYHLPIEAPGTLTDTSPAQTAGIIYETCKTQTLLHLYDSRSVLSQEDIERDIMLAKSRGISLIQYIAPSDSPAARSLGLAGIQPRREEIILRVAL